MMGKSVMIVGGLLLIRCASLISQEDASIEEVHYQMMIETLCFTEIYASLLEKIIMGDRKMF